MASFTPHFSGPSPDGQKVDSAETPATTASVARGSSTPRPSSKPVAAAVFTSFDHKAMEVTGAATDDDDLIVDAVEMIIEDAQARKARCLQAEIDAEEIKKAEAEALLSQRRLAKLQEAKRSREAVKEGSAAGSDRQPNKHRALTIKNLRKHEDATSHKGGTQTSSEQVKIIAVSPARSPAQSVTPIASMAGHSETARAEERHRAALAQIQLRHKRELIRMDEQRSAELLQQANLHEEDRLRIIQTSASRNKVSLRREEDRSLERIEESQRENEHRVADVADRLTRQYNDTLTGERAVMQAQLQHSIGEYKTLLNRESAAAWLGQQEEMTATVNRECEEMAHYARLVGSQQVEAHQAQSAAAQSEWIRQESQAFEQYAMKTERYLQQRSHQELELHKARSVSSINSAAGVELEKTRRLLHEQQEEAAQRLALQQAQFIRSMAEVKSQAHDAREANISKDYCISGGLRL